MEQNSNYPGSDYQGDNYQNSGFQNTNMPNVGADPGGRPAPESRNWLVYAAFVVVIALIIVVSVLIGISIAKEDSPVVQQPFLSGTPMQSNTGNSPSGIDPSGNYFEASNANTSTAPDATHPVTEPTDDLLNDEDENTPTSPTGVPPQEVPIVIPIGPNYTPEYTPGPNAATKKLNAIWQTIPAENRFFVFGGDPSDSVEGAAGDFSLDDEYLTAILYVPADQVANLTCASSLMHGMIANNFTCGMYQVSGDAAAFAEAMKASIGSVQWICGMPEKLIIAVIDSDFVLVCFGINDTIAPFEAALHTVYADANVLYNEAIAG